MRVLYDGAIFEMQAAGGINRYFANLIGRLPDDFSPVLATSAVRQVNWPQHPCLQVLRYRQPRFRPRRLSSHLESLYLQAQSRRHYDLVHPTYYRLLTRTEMSACPSPIVLTVYDMIHERFAQQLDPTGQGAAEKRRAVAAADAIVCISRHTKNDLIEMLGVPEEKITVTYLASELDASLSHGLGSVPERPYFLYVGSRAPYKNFDGLLLAHARATERRAAAHMDVILCVVGPAFGDEEHARIAALGLEGRVEHLGHPDDGHLAKLYRCSLAFVYPSFYEGFGIPPLEAMACGAVVAAANTSSIPEVVGDAALLFDPSSGDDLTSVLLALLEGTPPREALIARGLRQAAKFSWNTTAAQTLDVYRSVAG